jgi:hypothetical protein
VNWSDYDLTEREAAQIVGFLRVGFGALLFLSPSLALRAWTQEGATTPAARTAARAMGGRDVALGLGLLLAMENGAPVRGWLEAGALADIFDAVSTAMAWRRLPKLRALLVMATSAGSAMLQMQLAPVVDE